MAEAFYEPTPATDGATMNPVPGAVFQVYEISDTTFSTPLSLRVGAGNPVTEVAASETLATLPGVYVTSDNYEHHWKSGSFVWRRDSIDGAKKNIEAAKNSASNSAANAEASAQAARDAAALVGAPADTVMRDVAANPASAFATQQREVIASVGAATFQPRELARLAPMLRPRDIPPVATLNLTYSADATPIIASAVTWGVLDGPVDLLSCVPQLASGELDGGYVRNTSGRTDTDANRAVYGIEWVADGNTELRFRAFTSTPQFRLYVDDVPAQATTQDVTGVTLAGGTNFRVGITHPTPGVSRRFRLLVSKAGLRSIFTAPTTSIYAPRMNRIRVAIVGTSFSDNSGSVALLIDSWVWSFAERYGVEILNCARSGSGYVGTGGPKHIDQVPVAIGWKPDLTICEGSGNDVTASGVDLQIAAAHVFSELQATGTPVIAVGMLPRGASEISGTAAKVIAFTKAAADAAPNVLGFIDPIGTIDPLPAYATGAAYAAGAKVSYLNTTWQARNAISSAPATFDRSKWKPLSWNFGTGKAGTPTGDGNREVTVQADDLHPTAVGAAMIASNIGPRLTNVLASAVSSAA